ncbi:MAG: hypothetical protein KDJ36_18675, partial [Hyphomicrobiaceae bacterium]|nr:hypothetical protein [Hyphomicrobiaceae bacterium]
MTEKIVRQLLEPSIQEMSPKYADLEKAVGAFGDNNVEEATRIMEEVCRANPELPPTGVLLAKLFAFAQNQAGTRSALERAVRDNPDDPEAYVVFGDDNFKQGRFADASLNYDKAIDAAEKYSANEVRKKLLMLRALSGKAAVLEAGEKWSEAVPLLQRITSINTENLGLQARLRRAI